ncbi:amidohydrolase [Tissierella sp. MSJ-40]|uniref:Peptidase M20 domain-containing protein 2 n=1 Tax=Tissierella simiarum TaxID=2841534 RepID=A0ABS6E712_9FIRM|nr:amidohydrolase [Tissierella simiarum]
MNVEKIKENIINVIDENKEKIIAIGRDIYDNPEIGYKEYETTEKVFKFLKELDLEVEKNIAVTGCRARITYDESSPRIALLGEMDAIYCKEHKDSLENGAIHGCGHNVQIAGLLGAVIGLIKSNALAQIGGNIDILAVPAEEFIEIGYRSSLREKKIIEFFGGKQELIRRGYFDDVDISMMFHVLDLSENKALVGPVSNGFIGKKIKFIGKASHAGSAPDEGINALNAAMLAMNNINVQRETFKDKDRVRVHSIITKGGDIVNVIPSEVVMESYVRARTLESMISSNKKVNRAIKAGAEAVGAGLEIEDIPGYFPILSFKNLDDLFRQNLELLGLEGKIISGGDFTGSFDFGDLSHIMPTLHPMIGGIKGSLHSKDYEIIDEELAYIIPAKAMALTVVDLLVNQGEKIKEIKEKYPPKMTKEEYLQFMYSMFNVYKMDLCEE